MRKLLLTLLLGTAFTLTGNLAQAADGDTTVVQAHQDVHWNWNGNFHDTVSFPTTGTYQKVIMHYKLGCPSIGCSGWDYTTNIQLWDENNTSDKFELAKVITPYAGNRNQGWYHEYKFDVTHLLPLLTGDKVINARYDGWQDGFTITVFFEFIEGTPPRTPLSVDQVYFGGYKYGDNTDPINTQLQTVNITKDANTQQAEFIMSATGHGFGNNNGQGTNPENCAEFCDKWYKVNIDGSTVAQQTVWRNDCGSEPLYAQTGTWVYNRAGWCPGSESQVFKHDITASIDSKNTFDVKVDWQNYTANNVNMSYNISGQVVQYGAANHALDAEIYDVLNPSNYDRYSRYNPTAQKPRIILRNTGSNTLYSAKIKYGVEGGTFYTVDWVGQLEFMETEEVTLPIPDHNFFKGSSAMIFIAELLEANGSTDEVASNNKYSSPFSNIDQYNGEILLTVRTNNEGQDTWYKITNAKDSVVLLRNNLSNNTFYRDTLNLPDGAYTFYIEDAGGDGLSWWANTGQGNGSMQFKNIGLPNSQPPLFINSMEADFGNLFIQDFSVGYDIVVGNPNYDETGWTPPSTVGIQSFSPRQENGLIKMYPNPVDNTVNIESVKLDGPVLIQVYNQLGHLVFQSHKNMNMGQNEQIDVTKWSTGIYHISVSDDLKRETITFIKK